MASISPDSTTTGTSRPRKSPLVAGILSAIAPGAGHIYAGKIATGIGYFALFASMAMLLFWTKVTNEFEIPDALSYMLIGLMSIYYVWLILSASLLAGNRPFFPAIGAACVLAFIYLLGWQVIEVDFGNISGTVFVLTRVMWPWQAAIQREQTITSAVTKFANPCPADSSELPSQVSSGDGKPWVAADPACGEFSSYVLGTGVKPGTLITFRGGGFEPNKPIAIWWTTTIGDPFQPQQGGETVKVNTDGNGAFEVSFNAPQLENRDQVGVQLHKLEARQVASEGGIALTENFKLAIDRMMVTIFEGLMATSFGIVFAIPLSFIASRNLTYANPIMRAVYYGVRFIMNIIRSIEPFIWGVIVIAWVGLGPFAGVMALTIHTIASLVKLYSEAIESIDPGPIEAITATGANRIQTIVYGIIPQVIPPFISFTIYRWDINVRMATIIGLIGGGGIGQVLFQWINQSHWREAGMACWLITITVTAMDYASAEIRKRYV